MRESPKTDAKRAVEQMFADTRTMSRHGGANFMNGKAKPKQLVPLNHKSSSSNNNQWAVDNFDMKKHQRRNKKLAEQFNRGSIVSTMNLR